MRQKVKTTNSFGEVQEYEIEEFEDHAKLYRWRSKENKVIQIPSTFMLKPLTWIGPECFANCKCVREFIIPDTVSEIGYRAFRDCRGLRRVILPKNLKKISYGLFAFCYLENTEIVIPEGLETIEEHAFFMAGELHIKIPDSVKYIETGAFYTGFGSVYPETKLPEDPRWYNPWPYGEHVVCDGNEGKIVGIKRLKELCDVHSVETQCGQKKVFFPCDYLDGEIVMANEESRKRLDHMIQVFWDSEYKLKEAYDIHSEVVEACRKGICSYWLE